jgi:hypothetical protein
MKTKMKMAAWVGKWVRLNRDIETRGKSLYQAGDVCQCTGHHRGRLVLRVRHFDTRSTIRQVPPCDVALITERHCRECGCTDNNCTGCIVRTGEPCHWVETDLCSACVKGR